MILAMLGIGLAMMVSLADYHTLISIHRPLGIAILVLVVVRFINRQLSTLPPFPISMSARGAKNRRCVGTHDVRPDAAATFGRLGDALGRRLSDRAVWLAASALYPAA